MIHKYKNKFFKITVSSEFYNFLEYLKKYIEEYLNKNSIYRYEFSSVKNGTIIKIINKYNEKDSYTLFLHLNHVDAHIFISINITSNLIHNSLVNYCKISYNSLRIYKNIENMFCTIRAFPDNGNLYEYGFKFIIRNVKKLEKIGMSLYYVFKKSQNK